MTDDRAIATHLHATADALRRSAPEGLARGPALRRRRTLEALEGYAARGVFPRNDALPRGRRGPSAPGGYRGGPSAAPVFVDRSGTACAVGHLLRASGHGALADAVAREGNHRFVGEIRAPALDAWAGDHGLARAELARIQPGYAFVPPPAPRELAAVVDLDRTALSGPGLERRLSDLHAAIALCLDRHPSTAPIHVVHVCDERGRCEATWYGEGIEVMRCAAADPVRESPGRIDLVVRPSASSGELVGSAPTAPAPAALAACVGRRPPAPFLPRFDEPSLELWIDPDGWSTIGDAAAVAGRLAGLERCVRTGGNVPASGTVSVRTGPYGSRVAVETGEPVEARIVCLDADPGLWQASSVAARLEARVRVTAPGEGPAGWWRPSVQQVPDGWPVRSGGP